MDKHFNKLKWKCRRGMLELDLVLENFLNTHYAALSESEKQAFEQLLDYSDPELIRLVMGFDVAKDDATKKILRLLNEVNAGR